MNKENIESYRDNELDHIWFCADLHLLHEKIFQFFPKRLEIAFKETKDNIEMSHDKWLIDRINSKVGKKDKLYLLGDVSLGSKIETEKLLDTLNGKKILIVGNHDKNILHSTRFQEIKQIKNFTFNSESCPNLHIVLCHYPISVWERQEHGSLHLHGHCHGKSDELHRTGFNKYGIDVNEYFSELLKNKKSLDVGVDANNYYPISLREVLEKLNYEHLPKLKRKELQNLIFARTPSYREVKLLEELKQPRLCTFTEKLDANCFNIDNIGVNREIWESTKEWDKVGPTVDEYLKQIPTKSILEHYYLGYQNCLETKIDIEKYRKEIIVSPELIELDNVIKWFGELHQFNDIQKQIFLDVYKIDLNVVRAYSTDEIENLYHKTHTRSEQIKTGLEWWENLPNDVKAKYCIDEYEPTFDDIKFIFKIEVLYPLNIYKGKSND